MRRNFGFEERFEPSFSSNRKFFASLGRTVASMWMLKDDQEYLGKFCDAAKDIDNEYEIPLSEAQLLWDFPGIPGEPGYEEFKMGFPSWDHIRTKWVEQTQKAPLLKDDFKKLYKATGHHLGNEMQFKESWEPMWHVIKNPNIKTPRQVGTRDLFTEQGATLFRRLLLGVGEFGARHLRELRDPDHPYAYEHEPEDPHLPHHHNHLDDLNEEL